MADLTDEDKAVWLALFRLAGHTPTMYDGKPYRVVQGTMRLEIVCKRCKRWLFVDYARDANMMKIIPCDGKLTR